MASPQSTLPNDEKEAQDSAYNPGEQAHREGMSAEHSGADIDQIESYANDPANHDSSKKDTKSAEEDAGGGWKSNYSGVTSKDRQGITKANFRAILKKRGPIAAIVTLLLGGGIGAGVFFGPALLLVQIQESFVNTFDTQDTSMTIRTNKILANKLVDKGTVGSCNIIKIACRFARPSNKLLKNLEKNGVIARDANNNIISRKDTGFQTKRPTTYTFKGEDISAKNFSSKLRTDADFRAAFRRAYNPKFAGFTDKVFGKIRARFGFDTSNKDASSGKKTADRLNESSRGVNSVAGEAADEGSEGIVKKLLTSRATQLMTKISKAGKGDTFGLVAATVCGVADIPQLVVSTVRGFQMVQLVNYSMQFLIAGSALKAGQITQEQATALGALLTTAVANKTAMDSFGMKYALYGDTHASSKTFQKFIPGGSAAASLGGISSLLSSDVKKDSCAFATNPATGAGITTGLAIAGPETLGISLGIAALNIGAGFAISAVLQHIVVPLISEALKGVDVKPLLGFFLGDLTQNLAGEDVGNALASGASNMMAQTSNAGGNMPLTVDQAVAYNQSTQDVNLAYAQEDRATHSPFDPTNPNTMVGSIVGKMIPYFTGLNSIGSTLKSIASIPLGSFSTLITTSTASALTAEQYSLCNDVSITRDGIAAGPFCNVIYGIPTQYLDIDPQQVVDDLVASGDVDVNTGDPIDRGGEGLSLWISTCTDGSTDELKNCQIVDNTTAEYSLYIIDHRIQQSMDGDDGTADSNSSGNQGYTPNNDIGSLFADIAGVETDTIDTASVAATLTQTYTPTYTQVQAASPVVSSISTVINKSYNTSLLQSWYWSVA